MSMGTGLRARLHACAAGGLGTQVPCRCRSCPLRTLSEPGLRPVLLLLVGGSVFLCREASCTGRCTQPRAGARSQRAALRPHLPEGEAALLYAACVCPPRSRIAGATTALRQCRLPLLCFRCPQACLLGLLLPATIFGLCWWSRFLAGEDDTAVANNTVLLPDGTAATVRTCLPSIRCDARAPRDAWCELASRACVERILHTRAACIEPLLGCGARLLSVPFCMAAWCVGGGAGPGADSGRSGRRVRRRVAFRRRWVFESAGQCASRRRGHGGRLSLACHTCALETRAGAGVRRVPQP